MGCSTAAEDALDPIGKGDAAGGFGLLVVGWLEGIASSAACGTFVVVSAWFGGTAFSGTRLTGRVSALWLSRRANHCRRAPTAGIMRPSGWNQAWVITGSSGAAPISQ